LSGLRIFLARIQPILAGFKFSDHEDFPSRGTPTQILPSCVSTLNVFKSTLAGPLVTLPVRASKHELCHGATCPSKNRAAISWKAAKSSLSNIRSPTGLRASGT
jgi:hypothetical protein